MNNLCYLHTDFTKYLGLEKIIQKKIIYKNQIEFIEEAMELMFKDIVDIFGNNIILPVYNYDFAKNKIFDIINDKSQTGFFTEFCRKKNIYERSYIPMFSSLGLSKELVKTSVDDFEIDPFDKFSDFAFLLRNNGKIINFGSDFSPTFIHFIENQLKSGPVYRYIKKFDGNIIFPEGKIKKVILKFHVRPKGLNIRYDLKKIQNDLIKNNIMKTFHFEKKVIYQIVNSKDFFDYSFSKLNKDPYYFIDDNSKNILRKNNLNEKIKVKMEDFE